MSRDLLEKIDDWMFDAVFQRFAHWFQGLTGRDNFFLTRCLIVINCAGQTAYNAKEVSLVAAFLPNVFVFGLGFLTVSLVESRTKRNQGTSLAMNM